MHVVGKLHAASKLEKKMRVFHVYFSKYLVLMFCESLSNPLDGKAPLSHERRVLSIPGSGQETWLRERPLRVSCEYLGVGELTASSD